MSIFLVYLSVMGNAAAVASLGIYLDPKLTGLMSQTLFGIGSVVLFYGLCGFGVFAGAARDDYRRRSLDRYHKRMSEDPAGIALRAELDAQGERDYQERLRQKQLRIERIDAELAAQRKDFEKSDKAFYAECAARQGGKLAYEPIEYDDEFWAAVVRRQEAQA
jgi:hypothetical protein